MTRIRDTGFIACKTCHYAILPLHINSHFRQSPHRLDQETRNRIFEQVRQWPNLILNINQINEYLGQISKSSQVFSELSLYEDGFGCLEHDYIVRNRRSIQDHFRRYHEWTNPRTRGRKLKDNNEVP